MDVVLAVTNTRSSGSQARFVIRRTDCTWRCTPSHNEYSEVDSDEPAPYFYPGQPNSANNRLVFAYIRPPKSLLMKLTSSWPRPLRMLKHCHPYSFMIRTDARALKVHPAAIPDFRNLSALLATLKVAYHTIPSGSVPTYIGGGVLPPPPCGQWAPPAGDQL
ncbi:hypothetical protein EVAR_99227_1 [Eumeta japonica]|uniref:Uncharacterized protein n=1 Tax=Eumeta variegata TaxID=151549 RepID=A0A4C1YMM5_EUMVA|nr:hypothetical protein EVAR_99227_1 [Eumeta japonica]